MSVVKHPWWRKTKALLPFAFFYPFIPMVAVLYYSAHFTGDSCAPVQKTWVDEWSIIGFLSLATWGPPIASIFYLPKSMHSRMVLLSFYCILFIPIYLIIGNFSVLMWGKYCN